MFSIIFCASLFKFDESMTLGSSLLKVSGVKGLVFPSQSVEGTSSIFLGGDAGASGKVLDKRCDGDLVKTTIAARKPNPAAKDIV